MLKLLKIKLNKIIGRLGTEVLLWWIQAKMTKGTIYYYKINFINLPTKLKIMTLILIYVVLCR